MSESITLRSSMVLSLRMHSHCFSGVAHDSLPPTTQLELLMLAVGGTARWPSLSGTLALRKEAAGLAASGGETTQLAVLHDGLANPIDAGIITDNFVIRIDHDNFKPLCTASEVTQ